MKPIPLVIFIGILIFGLTPASADMMTSTVSATITSIDIGSSSVISVGQQIDLFTVTYDDQGVIMHQFYEADGAVYRTEHLSDYPSTTFMDDAIFTISTTVNDILTEWPNEWEWIAYRDWINQSTTGRIDFDVQHNSLGRFYGVWNGTENTNVYAELRTFSASGQENLRILFGNPSSVITTQASVIPEPTTMLLLGTGLLGLAGSMRKFKA